MKMNLIGITKNLILEASAKDVLVNKLKLSDKAAEFFAVRCGKLSLIIVNKILEQITSNISDKNNTLTAVESLNDDYLKYDQDLASIMDWVRVELNGNLTAYKNDSFKKLTYMAKEWHDNMEVGSGNINYKENEKNIILDFRDEDGIGFYWIDLQKSHCTEEKKRMGHCSATRGSTLYSLRETIKMKDKFSVNKSHLTAAIEEKQTGNIIIQLKGQKNSKPSKKYHKYIVELLLDSDSNITGFGSEYDTKSDFKINDLNDEFISIIIKNKPELTDIFTQYDSYKKGFIENKPVTIFDIVVPNHHYKVLLDNFGEGEENRLEEVFSGDLFSDYHWEDFENYVGQTLEQKIENYVNNLYHSDELEDIYDFDNMSLVKKISKMEYLDYPVGELIEVLGYAMDSASIDAYYRGYYNYYKRLFENYGKVLEFNDEYVKIRIDILNFPEIKGFHSIGLYKNDLSSLFFDAAEESFLLNAKPRVNPNHIDVDMTDDLFEKSFYEKCADYNLPITKN